MKTTKEFVIKQNNSIPFDLASFFKNGALVQMSQNQFKLILGPFRIVKSFNAVIANHETALLQPDFWDFLPRYSPNSSIKSLSSSEKVILLGEAVYEFTRDQLVEELLTLTASRPPIHWAPVNEDLFVEQFLWSQESMALSELRKTVPIIEQEGRTTWSHESLNWCLQNLLKVEQQGWTYGFWQNGKGYLGHSPELIADWSAKNQTFSTAALAGTFKPDIDESVAWKDQKTKDEHEIVIEDIFEQLKTVLSAKQIKQSHTYLQRLAHLSHFKTDFTVAGILFEQAIKLIDVLHPTAALGIFPRRYEFFQKFSQLKLQTRRKTFAAPLTFISPESVFSIGMIRNLFFSEDCVQIFSGCGVTAASELKSELQELDRKRTAVKKILGLAND